MSVVILLLEEMLLTFGTELIAFFSNRLNSASEFCGEFRRSWEKACVCASLTILLNSDFQPPHLARRVDRTVHLQSASFSGLLTSCLFC